MDFFVSGIEGTWVARAKLIYLVPLAHIMFPFMLMYHGWVESGGYPALLKEIRDTWNQ